MDGITRPRRGGLMRVLSRLVPLCWAAALLAGCDLFTGPGADSAPRRIEQLPRALSAGEQEVIARSNTFAFGLLREVYQRETKPNVFLSPLSASMALGMVLNGAAGATFDSLRATLGFEGLTQEEINRSYQQLTEMLLALDPKVEISIANSTWARRGFPFESAFYDAVTTWFGAEARELDFESPSALAAINGWAAEHTKQRIPKVLDEISPDAVMFLLNAIYFKGQWMDRFDPEATRAAPFTLADGSVVQVPSLRGEVKAGVAALPGVLLVELPYGGQAFVLTIALPTGENTLEKMVAGLDDATWANWTAALPRGDYAQLDEIDVQLPKLELDYETFLNDPLTALGMGNAFDPARADFRRLTPRPVYISFVKQNTFLKLDEEGTEAAAVTTVGIELTSVGPQRVVVDRPYMLAIRERLSGTILFLGVIGDPR